MTNPLAKQATETPHTGGARYLILDKAFSIHRAPVPAHIFVAERDEALAANAPTAVIPCDLSAVIGGKSPATVPLLLASYLRVQPGAPLRACSGASTELYYVIQGSGLTRWEGETIRWHAGDAMILPGGIDYVHEASGQSNAVLWQCTNAPQLAFEHARPAAAGAGPVAATHFPDARIKQELAAVRATVQTDGSKSTAMLFSAESMDGRGTSTPSLTLVLNTLDPGDSQPPHLHNSVAVTLIVQGDDAYSMIDGQRLGWSRYATVVTPARAIHSHHNDQGAEDAMFLIVQDGGLYYHCRTIGFENA